MIRHRRIRPENLNAWLKESLTRSPDGRYTHRLLQEELVGRESVWDELASCVQEAHEDGRLKLRKALEPTLSPFTCPMVDPAAGYPQDLHERTLMGYFGEVMAGLIAEHKDMHGHEPWRIPAFLFRFHQVAFQKLEQRRDMLTQGLTPAQLDPDDSIIPGRTGNDVLAFLLAADGDLSGILVCEAKCLSKHQAAKAKKAHEQLSTPARCPSGVREIIEILNDYDTDESREWRDRLRRFYFDPSRKVSRSDMLFYATGDKPTGRGGRVAWLSLSEPSPDYAGNRPLEVVEVHLDDPMSFVKALYRTTH
jgi:hypothetical protein